jgi:hypothetical protein
MIGFSNELKISILDATLSPNSMTPFGNTSKNLDIASAWRSGMWIMVAVVIVTPSRAMFVCFIVYPMPTIAELAACLSPCLAVRVLSNRFVRSCFDVMRQRQPVVVAKF